MSNGPNTSAGNIPQQPGMKESAVRQDTTIPAAVNVPARAQIQNMELLDMQALDPASLDPERHYRWVRTTSDDQPTGLSVTRHKLRGYDLELYRDGGPRTLAEAPAGEDGTVRMGDLVLMSCPKALRQERSAQQAAETARRLTLNTVTTKEQAKKMGVKVIEDRE